MTFETLAAYVVEQIKVDGDTTVSLPESAPYYSTTFGLRQAVHLKTFTKLTCLLYDAHEAITLASGDLTFSLIDSGNCAKQFFEVHDVFISGEKILEYPGIAALIDASTDGATGNPTAWAMVNDTAIMFDKSPTGAISNSWVRGFYRHADIASDSTTIEFADDHVPLFAAYASYFLRKNVAADEVGIQRMFAEKQDVADGIKRLKGASMRYFARK